MEFICNLDKLIKESKYKTKHIEKEMGINKSTLSSWRNGKTTPSIIQALQLAQILGCNVNDVYQLKKENDE